MPRPRRFLQSRVSLLREGAPERYRPILVGPAILVRPDRYRGGEGPWRMMVHPGSRLVPVVTAGARRFARTVRLLSEQGIVHRIGAAIATPFDFDGGTRSTAAERLLDAVGGPGLERMIYGWSLAYRLPGGNGPASIDPHDEIPELPAFYESPWELLDRVNHLESRGVATRPIALMAQEEDFARTPRGGARVNRFFPQLTVPCGS